MGLEQLIETQIQEAMEAGAFDHLPGAGKPLAWSDLERLAGDNWLGYKVLQNGGMLPEWLGLAREIERDQEQLARLDERHASLCDSANAEDDWPRYLPGIRVLLSRYEDAARELRKKQDRFNMSAPSLRSERPAIWVEHHLARLRARMPDAPSSEPEA
ncbi:MAG: DnaJ family domain-containing protein [Tepidiformaceae bacterium]